MHIARVGERLPRLQIQFRISRSFRPRNLANLGSKIRFWIRRKEHTLRSWQAGCKSWPYYMFRLALLAWGTMMFPWAD